LFLIVYVYIDDWYKKYYGNRISRGSKARLSDSEVLTLLIGRDFMEFTSERHYIEFMRSNYRKLFPAIVDHSQYNRRARKLRSHMNALRTYLTQALKVNEKIYRIIDTTLVPVMGYYRDKRHSDFLSSGSYGYCSSRRIRYFGYKLVLTCTLQGIPEHIELVPANTDERVAADEVLEHVPVGCRILGDKGFIGEEWKSGWRSRGIEVITPRRENQVGFSLAFNKVLGSARERIESVFKQLKEGARSIERTLAHTIEGLCTRITAKITSLMVKIFLRKKFGIDVLNFHTI
jgi:hypothetical protein